MEDIKTITLRKPVSLGGVEYKTLELREPTAGELHKAQQKGGTPVGQVIQLVHMVAKVPLSVAEGISQRDLREVSDFLGAFSDESPEISATASLS